MYLNLKKPKEVIVENCENNNKIVEDKKEDKIEEKEEKIIIDIAMLNNMISLLPTLKNTDYLDYNLFQKKTFSKEEISSFNTALEPTNFKEVFYEPYQIEITSKNTELYLYIVIHDKVNGLYYESSLENDNPLDIVLFDQKEKELFQKYGGRYKITYVNGAFGYLFEKIEFINGKR